MEEENIMRKLSASAISTFLSCPLKYKFQNIDMIERPSNSPHLIYGSAVHKAIETLHRSIWSGFVISERQMAKTFVDFWQLGIELNDVPIKWYRETTEREMTDSGITAVKNYYKVHKNDTPPPTVVKSEEEYPAVEVYFSIPLDGLIGMPGWILSGIIDLIKDEDGAVIIDHKTGSSKYSEFQVKTNLQLALYSYAFRHMCGMGLFPKYPKGTKEKYVMFDVISKKKAIIYYHKRVISDSTYKHLGHIVKTMIGQIEKEEFLPNYGPTCQAYGGCDFLDHCVGFKYE